MIRPCHGPAAATQTAAQAAAAVVTALSPGLESETGTSGSCSLPVRVMGLPPGRTGESDSDYTSLLDGRGAEQSHRRRHDVCRLL